MVDPSASKEMSWGTTMLKTRRSSSALVKFMEHRCDNKHKSPSGPSHAGLVLEGLCIALVRVA